jgi:hypothetical protein
LQGGKDLRECSLLERNKERDAMHPDKKARRFGV